MGDFIGFFSSIFGYVLNLIYNLIHNYGLAIIIFSILLKLAMLPISVKQQKTMRKTAKIQGTIKEIQKKYKKDPEKMNKEVMAVYKKENMSPLSGCMSMLIQILLLFAMFYLVRSPLTYMKHISPEELNNFMSEIKQTSGEGFISPTYPEISVVKYAESQGAQDNKFYINMDFLGLDLSNVPKENLYNWTVYIIPVLYVISSMISIKLTTNMNAKTNKKQNIIVEGENKKAKLEDEVPDMATQMNKSMMWLMPIMSVSISIIAPLGLALYWLLNNLLMIAERLILNKFVFDKEDEKKDEANIKPVP